MSAIPSPSSYQFLPWVRSGIAKAITTPDTLGAGLAGHVTLQVTLRVNHDSANDVHRPVRLHGPGDVIGLDPKQVIRTEPRHQTMNFEPNYFPAVEFDQPELPWLFTPATTGAQDRLRPWICLGVVHKQDGVMLTIDPNQPLPVLEITSPANPSRELPDLAESWAWAHAQVLLSQGDASIEAVLNNNPERTASRLLCPRKLEPRAHYYACVVPTFDVGRKAGLGELVTTQDEQDLKPAWMLDSNAPRQLRLPVYYHWEFGTGAADDFEALVRRLQGRLPPQVGRREMDISDSGAGLPKLQPGSLGSIVHFEGALHPPQSQPSAWTDPSRQKFQEALRTLLNAPATYQSSSNQLVVAPPLYGSWHAAQRTIPDGTKDSLWLKDLNLDPRYRAAAGLGTLVVQQQQEQLMASAWEQLGDIQRINRLLRHAQLATSVSGALYEKRFKAMKDNELMQITGPAHSRFRVNLPQTLNYQIRQSKLPEAAVTGSFRRIVRPRGPVARRVLPSDQRRIRPYIQSLASGKLAAAPPRKPPKGTVTMDGVTDALQSGGPSAPFDDLRFDKATSEIIRTAPAKPDFSIIDRDEGLPPPTQPQPVPQPPRPTPVKPPPPTPIKPDPILERTAKVGTAVSTSAAITRTIIPAPVTYRGMPASRWWEFEDAQVDFGAIEAGPEDLARLLLIEFAVTYGNDWFVVPVEVPVGSVCRIRSLVVTDTFGERTLVRPAHQLDGAGSPFRMFRLTPTRTFDLNQRIISPDLFFLPPVLAASLQSPPVEEVLFLRDEMANMAWAVERFVESPAGHPLNRYEAYQKDSRPRERQRETEPTAPSQVSTRSLTYRLVSAVPDHWIPLLPVKVQGTANAMRLQRGAMMRSLPNGSQERIMPAGRILEPSRDDLNFYEEEVPRAGLRVTRAFQYARWIDGSTHLWVGRRKQPGRGEGSSGLRFDMVERG